MACNIVGKLDKGDPSGANGIRCTFARQVVSARVHRLKETVDYKQDQDKCSL